jgi:DNA repair protein RadC
MSRYAASFYRREENEKLVVFCADESGRLLAVKELAFGKKTNVEIDIRQISQFALKCGAKQVAIAHNHPGLSGKPSSEDILITNNLRDFLEKIGIKLVEHYVVGCDKVVTLWGDNYIHDTE